MEDWRRTFQTKDWTWKSGYKIFALQTTVCCLRDLLNNWIICLNMLDKSVTSLGVKLNAAKTKVLTTEGIDDPP